MHYNEARTSLITLTNQLSLACHAREIPAFKTVSWYEAKRTQLFTLHWLSIQHTCSVILIMKSSPIFISLPSISPIHVQSPAPTQSSRFSFFKSHAVFGYLQTKLSCHQNQTLQIRISFFFLYLTLVFFKNLWRYFMRLNTTTRKKYN